MTARLTEAAQNLIIAELRLKLPNTLRDVQADWGDNLVSLEPPPFGSYFIYPQAQGYACPAIFVIDEGMDLRLDAMKSNFINGDASINVSMKVEDRDEFLTTKKAQRYQSALFEILNLAELDSADNLVKLKVTVKRLRQSPLYTIKNAEQDSTKTYYKEIALELKVDFFESFT